MTSRAKDSAIEAEELEAIEEADREAMLLDEENDTQTRDKRLRAEYLAAWQSPEVAEWLANLTPEQKREAKKLGLDKPALPAMSGAVEDFGGNVTHADFDFTDDGEEIERPDKDAATVDEVAENEAQDAITALRVAYADGLRNLAMLLVESKNARVTVECFALVTGLAYEGISMASIGRKHGLTRAAVSKRCIEMCRSLSLQPSRAMMVKFSEADVA